MKNEKINTKKTESKSGISAVVSLAVVVVAVVVVGFLARKSTKDFEKTVVTQTQQHLLNIAKTGAQDVQANILDWQDELKMLAENPRIKRAVINDESAQDILEADGYSPEIEVYKHLEDFIDGLYRLDAKGIVQSRIPFAEGREGADFSHKPDVEVVLKTHKPYISKFFPAASGEKCFSVCHPVFEQEQFNGIVRVMVYLRSINNIISNIKVGRKGHAWMIDDSGLMMSHSKPEHVGKDIIATRKAAFPNYDWFELENIVEKMTSGEAGVGSYHSAWWLDEKPQLVRKCIAFAPARIGNQLWSIGVSMGYDETSGPIITHSRSIFLGAGFIILLFIGAGAGFYRVQKRKVELAAQVKSAEKLKSINQQLLSEITERKQVELSQDKLFKKVDNINKELKEFASIVSHDLKAPLRGIKTLASWILSDCADKLGDEANEQMNLLLERVERMYNLIEGTLQYSRAGRVEGKRVRVNLNNYIPEIINMVAPPEDITVTIENELPVIECEETHIMQVFQNLLSNAIKYMDKPQGWIKVGCVEQDGFWKFSVADNGPGIEEKHFEKIFKIFQTLSTSPDFEGTGIGLTVAKKIVELYDGKIWVESKVGEGSTFFFTLPMQEIGAKDAKLEANITC